KLSLAYFEPRQGISETQWLSASDEYFQNLLKVKKENGINVDERVESVDGYRFRIHLQPGLQRNTAKLQLLLSTHSNEWSKVSDSLAMENIILDDLAKYLGERIEEKSTTSLLAQQMTRNFEVNIVDEGNNSAYLLIN